MKFKFSNIKPLAIAVIIFIGLLLWGYSSEASADTSLTIGLSYGWVNSEGLVTQRLGLLQNEKWNIKYERFGGHEFNTSHGFFLARRTEWRTDKVWQPYLDFGFGYYTQKLINPDKNKPLVNDNLVFTLAGGCTWRISKDVDLELGIDHNSTAGRTSPNSGIDRVFISLNYRL